MWTAIQAILVLAIPSIASWLMEAAAGVATSFIDEDLTKFSSSGNLLTSFEKVLNGTGWTIGVNLPNIILAISFVLIILFTLFSVINSMIASLEGESSESPIKVLLRALITVVMEVAIFGLPSLHSETTWFVVGGGGGILSALGQLASKILALISPTGFKMEASFAAGLTGLGIANAIVYVILCLSVFTGVISASIVFIERYLTFGLYVLVGPLAVATNTSKTTERTFHDWLTGLLSNFISLFISILGYRLFLNALTSVLKVEELTISSETLFKFATAIALMSLITNSEKIANALGFRTIANGDTARSIAAGTRLASRAFMMTGGKAIAGGLNHINNRGTQERANFMSKTFGANSLAAKPFNYLNAARNGAIPLNSKYNMASNKVAATSDGKIQAVKTGISGNISPVNRDSKLESNILSTERRNQAIDNINNSMYDDKGNVNIGKRVDMKDGAAAFGVDGNSGIRIKETGVVAQMSNGKAGIIAQTQIQNDKGIWEDKTMVFTPTSEQFDAGAGLITTQNGAMGYSIKENGDLYQLGNNSMQMTEIEKSSSLNADQFKAMPDEIYQNFTDNEAYNAQMHESINHIESQIENGNYYSSLEASGAFFNADNENIYKDSIKYNETPANNFIEGGENTYKRFEDFGNESDKKQEEAYKSFDAYTKYAAKYGKRGLEDKSLMDAAEELVAQEKDME